MANREEIKRDTQGRLVNRVTWKASIPHFSPNHGQRRVYSSRDCTALICLTMPSQDLGLVLAVVCALPYLVEAQIPNAALCARVSSSLVVPTEFYEY